MENLPTPFPLHLAPREKYTSSAREAWPGVSIAWGGGGRGGVEREITGGTDVSPPLPGSGSLEAQRGPLMTVICHFAVCCSLPVSLEPAPRKINIIYSRMHCFQILNTQISVSALQRHLWIELFLSAHVFVIYVYMYIHSFIAL